VLGAYVLNEPEGGRDVTLIATGSEVASAVGLYRPTPRLFSTRRNSHTLRRKDVNLSAGANAPSGQATHDRGTPGQFDPITIRIEDHRNASHVSQRDRRKAFAHALLRRPA
jgi:hypothetical protein